jgi:hypothetical protein
MESPEACRPVGRDPALSGRFCIGQLAWWLPACALMGGAVAWFAVVAERYYAPLVAFPILIGVFLGGALVAVMRAGQVGHRPTILAGTLLAAVLTIVGQHWLAFLAVRHSEAKDPKRAADLRLFEALQSDFDPESPKPPGEPPSCFGEYLGWRAERKGLTIGGTTLRGGLVWLIWAVDGLLVAFAAGVLVAVTAKLPFCDHCRTWYHTMRSGKIDEATARELARVADVSLPDASLPGPIRSARYRLVTCREGCGPMGLALSWVQSDCGFSSGYVWLDPSGYGEVLQTLEKQKAESGKQNDEPDAAEPPIPNP